MTHVIEGMTLSAHKTDTTFAEKEKKKKKIEKNYPVTHPFNYS